MKISELVYSLKRPVDLIQIVTPGDHRYIYDGYEENTIPLQFMDMAVTNWEVTVHMEMQSMCEINIMFTLTIETGD